MLTITYILESLVGIGIMLIGLFVIIVIFNLLHGEMFKDGPW